MSNQLDIVFKEELRGRNALHFWIGIGAIVGGIYMWWNGWFSAFFVNNELAPAALSDSYNQRGMGSTGFLSLTFDTVCLIGWAVVSVTSLMRRFIAGIMERLEFTSGGLYRWVQNQPEMGIDEKLETVARNHEKRINIVELKTDGIPMPELPPEPLTPEEQIAAMRQELNLLKAAQGQGEPANANITDL